jgi:hypothetical protein
VAGECLPVTIGSVVFILINVHAIPGRCFLEDSYGYLVSTVENIYSDIDVKNGKLRQRPRHVN